MLAILIRSQFSSSNEIGIYNALLISKEGKQAGDIHQLHTI